MLEKLLKRIRQGGSFSTQSLAHEFGVSEILMETMLEGLVRAGYIQSMSTCEDGSCHGCSYAAACKPRGKMWMLVFEK